MDRSPSEKLTGFQLVKKFPAFYGTQRFITAVTSARHLSLSRGLLFVSQHDTFYSEELLAPSPTPKLEDHPLSAAPDCLFNIFAATLHIGGRSSTRNLRTCHAVVTGTHLSWLGFGNTCPKLNVYIYINPLCIMQIRQLWSSLIEQK